MMFPPNRLALAILFLGGTYALFGRSLPGPGGHDVTSPYPPAANSNDLRRFLEHWRLTENVKDHNPPNEEIESHVLFREVGYLAGSVAYGHLLFTLNLSDVDSLLDGLQVKIQSNSRWKNID
jgi:hypothetical protein